ncbi:HAMP domain-containing sensor histidine kinase [Vineibacter terrae]|uniref:sensor histidine kinase n=1 Tax=Vineibacter terrae TaxID=2586908 RepID=UPI002E3044E1|nr:HAMP domain-containing sensor histidine kinase [Vineibacter terrae]HEX2890870.1 HAMP domain-containing sensor histidine kinase [Vineibacter terrae]
MSVVAGLSVRRRLLRNFSLLFIGTVTVLSLFYLWASWNNRDAEADDELEEVASVVVGRAERGPDGRVRLRFGQRRHERLADVAGLQVFVYDPANKETLIEQPSGMRAALPLSPEIAWKWAFLVIDRSGAPGQPRLQLLLATVQTPAGPLRVAVGRDEPQDTLQPRWIAYTVLSEVLPVIGPILLLAIGIALYTLTNALAPVAKAAEEANRITVDTMGKRLDTAVPAEIRPLVDAFNRALDRLDAGFADQRRFTANAAHELRTPLALLRARLDGMADTESADAIRRDLGRMTRLIEQLLAVSRLDSHMPMTKVDVDLVDVAGDIVARMAPLAVAEDKQVSLTAPDHPVRIYGNADALGAAVRNLIENALRFTPSGSAVEVVVADGPHLQVHDAGPGIPDEDRPHLFERFWRGRNRQGGAGLGLAIVAEVVAQHGGRISVNKSPMGGAMFDVTFGPQPQQQAAAAA